VTDAARREQITRALWFAGDTHTADDVLAQVARGELQLWEGEHSIVVTQILTYPRLKELCFFLAAGRMEEMKRLSPIILQWGRKQGCRRAVFAGRPGWARTFLTKEDGWTSPMVVFEKEL
jgi:hypothetical protein